MAPSIYRTQAGSFRRARFIRSAISVIRSNPHQTVSAGTEPFRKNRIHSNRPAGVSAPSGNSGTRRTTGTHPPAFPLWLRARIPGRSDRKTVPPS